MRKVFNNALTEQILRDIASEGPDGVYVYKLPARYKVSVEKFFRFLEQNSDSLEVKNGKVRTISGTFLTDGFHEFQFADSRNVRVPIEFVGPQIDVYDFYLPKKLRKL